MPTNTGSTKRFQQIINSFKQIITLLSSETTASTRMMFKGVTTKKLAIKKDKAPIKNLSLAYEEDVKINTIKQMYVLTKDYAIPDIITDVDLKSFDTNQIKTNIIELKEKPYEKERYIINFEAFNIISKLKTINIKPIEEPDTKPKNVIFEAKLHFIGKLTTEEPKNSSLPIDKINQSTIKSEDTILKTYSKKRSPSFPTNLPIEKKPTNLLLFTERDLSIFKRKLADKHKVNINLLKITSVYNNLNVNNLQNLKYDAKSGNIYYTFKPKTTPDSVFAFMVFGLRRDNNTTISTMVNTSDLKQT